MPLSATLAALLVLFVFAALAHPVALRLRVPYAVMLVATGLLLSFAAQAALPYATSWGAPISGAINFIAEPDISSDIFLFILLPILLFQGAVGLDIRHLARDSVAILALAILAVLFSILLIGGAVHIVTGLSLTACLLLAAIVATTDPSAVIALFRELGAPPRLTRLVEGESLLNDATAIAAFSILLTAAVIGTPPSLPMLGLQLSVGLIAGAILGLVAGLVLMRTLEALGNIRAAQMTLTLTTPYIIFLFGTVSVYVSGVVAVVVAGVVVGFIGRSRLDRHDFTFLKDLTDQASDWSTGLIFLLAALLVPTLLNAVVPSDLIVITTVILAATTARAVILWGVAPVLSLVGLMHSIEGRMNAALLWGGLRGAMTLALALSVSETAGLAPEISRTITVGATGYTLFTLFVQGTTLRIVVQRLGLTDLTSVERAFRTQALGDALGRTRERVHQFARRAGLNDGLVTSVLTPYEMRLSRHADQASFEDVSDKDKIRLGLLALVNHERNLLLQQRWSSGLPARMVDQYLYQ